MEYNKLPLDIIFYINKFVFSKCDKCKKICHFTNLYHNCIIFKYKNVFQDDYDFDEEIERFNLICKACIKKYKTNNIISSNNIQFNWTKDIS